MRGTRKVVLVLIFMMFPIMLFGKSGVEGFEFVDREIGEILYTLSMFEGIPIVGDDTVGGKATFRCAGENFSDAFDSFLKAERLFVYKTESKWTVSRVKFSEEGEDVFLEAMDVRPSRIVEKISEYFRDEISYDFLPEMTVSFRCRGNSSQEFLEALARQLGEDYGVEKNENGVRLFRKVNVKFPDLNNDAFLLDVVCDENDSFEKEYSVDVRDVYVSKIIERIFELEGKEFVFIGDNPGRINRLLFCNKNFEDSLVLLCRVGGLKYICEDEIYYVMNSGVSDYFNNFGKYWKRYDLSFGNAGNVVGKIMEILGKFEWISLDNENSFMCNLNDEGHSAVEDLIKSLDEKKEYYIVEFKYIKSDEFLSRLPPGMKSEQFSKCTMDNCLFFTGTYDEYKELEKSLKEIDVPVKRLSYDLLVMQYQYTGEETWESALTVSRLNPLDASEIGVSLGSVLGFNLDVVTAFGYKFAAKLQSAINENKAHIYADTKLHGVSGGKINFQNTTTYRYRDNNLDPETGKPIFTGITREIVSGIRIDVTGWISGDGMITSNITASVSRQGMDHSGTTGNPPPSSEKVITTEVRGKSGEPIILSGLVQNDESEMQQGVPFLSKIPFIGKLFGSDGKSNEKNELVIYLVPHWERDEVEENVLDVDLNGDENFDDEIVNDESCEVFLEERLIVAEEKMESDEDENFEGMWSEGKCEEGVFGAFEELNVSEEYLEKKLEEDEKILELMMEKLEGE